MRRIKNVIAACLLLFLGLSFSVRAGWDGEDHGEQKEYTDEETGYSALLYDEADVLSEEDENRIMEQLSMITAHGNAIFYSAVASGYADESRAQSMAVRFYSKVFSERSNGVIVAIILDNDNRGGCMLWVESFQKTHRVITTSYANSIADNAVAETKKHASGNSYYGYDGTRNYYGYASEALNEVYALLEGEKVAQPMKIVTSALLALILALLLNFIIVSFYNRKRKPKDREILAGLVSGFDIRETQSVLTRTDKKYSPRSSSSGGHGGGGGGGGGHGGGGHRG